MNMRSKDEVREAVWAAMEAARAAHTRKLRDRIPHFRGCEAAAEKVGELRVWQAARVIKGNPDKAQRPLRLKALEEGKTLYMAVPRLRQEQCFVELDPASMGASPAETSTIAGAFRWGRPVYVEEMRQVDLGGGFADLEYGLAIAAGIVSPETPVVSTVHQMQVLDEDLPYTRHDVFLDYVVTSDEVIECSGDIPRPTGIYWDDLTPAKIRQIPLLKKLQPSTG
ncbi:5-formyltetrahydrofolate cyclo-ligase-like protein COG0212 [Geodia barretti]|uniref:5-formyltetrahydrofolate cyclo-ligase-like protein COG0212 n=1 Tax=Geodia barretti TaxID=519541 RepID=A0AA35TZ13_GEOBA|nr:5-formyltetrahydrofolate cyclo-ligase-like protein COG0212 [Geodia barretti]